MKSKKQGLKKHPLSEYLATRMTVKEFEELVPKVFTTLNRKTFVFNNPEKAKFGEIEALASLAKTSAVDLMNNTRIGVSTMTYVQLEKIGFEFK